MKSPRKKRSPSNLKKRVIIDTCLLILVIVMVIFMKRYHPAPITKPEQIVPSIKSTTSDTNQPVSPESPYGKELSDIRTHQLREEDRQFLISKGLQDPIHDLVQDLMKHNELIPCKGIVGGTPGFYDPDRIAVLNKEHVTADYDDGHAEGTIELSFIVSNGTVSWTVVHSECGD
jgi:hypothetical protein